MGDEPMPLDATSGDDAPIHTHVTATTLQLLMGWDLTALRQLWESGTFPKPLDPLTAEPIWRADHILDWLHVRSESQEEAARYIREHHADIYERSLKKSKAEWRDVESENNKFVTNVEALLSALEEGIELIPRSQPRPSSLDDDEEEVDEWDLLVRHWKVPSYTPFQVAELKLQRAWDAIVELRESSAELVVKGSSFQFAFEQLRTAAEEFRFASLAIRQELANLYAINDVALSVFGLAARCPNAKAMHRRINQ
jgi:hypothetical protein